MPAPSLYKRLAIVLVSLLGVMALGTAYLFHETTEAERPAAPDTDRGALRTRGEYLARIGNCAHCHTARGGLPYAGGRAIETPFGPIYTSNLTPDTTNGIGTWSADDFWRALHFGLDRNGRALNPAFPYTSYTHVSRADTDALFAYLQSLAPAATQNRPAGMRWPYNSQWALHAWRKLYFTPDAAPELPTTATPPQRGAYLVSGLGHCMECHSARNALGARQGASGRGTVLPGSEWYAPALDADNEASVGHWSRQAVVRFLTTGVSPTGFATGPMAEVVLHGTQYLNAADADSMAQYLQGSSAAGASTAPLPTSRGNGAMQDPTVARNLYEQHCAQCHGSDGLGRQDVYPALAGNRNVTMANTNNLIHVVLGGGFAPATTGNPQPFGMPPFMLQLNDEEISAVLTYIRASWNNSAGAVSAFDVQHQRRLQAP